MKQFRNYKNSSITIKNFYKQQRTKQTFSFSQNSMKKYCIFNKKDPFWKLFNKLNNLFDISDPDVSLSNNHHAFQTAEAIRKDGHPKWMQFVGLIHDFGKILYLKGCDKDGTSSKTQWGIVGDTFILGCEIPNSIIYPEFNSLNPDSDKKEYNSKYGIYTPNIGLENVVCSFGHDEYLYKLLKFNNIKLPEEAFYMIRFHSLYLWHKENEYSHLENENDKKMKKWVKLFNKYDLYTKENVKYNVNLQNYYSDLVKHFLPKELFY